MLLPIFKVCQKMAYKLTIPLVAVLFSLVIVFRDPVLFLDPRFWAEEGALYFHHALVSPGLKDFFSPALGYYSLLVKIAVYLALFVPIENAPLITTAISGLVIWSCVILVITSANNFLDGFGVKCAFALMLLFISSGEIWLNTITSQFWLPIGVLFIIIDKSSRSFLARLWRYTFVFLAAMTGVMSFFLLPLVIYLLFLGERASQKHLMRIFILICLGLILQIVLILNFGFGFELANVDFQGGDRLDNGFSIYKIVKSLLGYYIVYPFTGIFIFDVNPVLYYILAVYFLFSIILVFLFKSWSRESLGILFTVVFASLTTIALSVGTAGGLRYAFMVNALVLLLIYSTLNKNEKNSSGKSLLTIQLLVLAWFTATLEFRYKTYNFSSPDWPSWQVQLSGQECVSKDIAIWPHEPFSWYISDVTCPYQPNEADSLGQGILEFSDDS
jgi:hypothetical protein